MNKKLSYGIRAAAIAGILLVVYLAFFLLFANLKKTGSWIGFGFAVLSLLITGAGLFLGVMVSDSLKAAANFVDGLQAIWLYPAASIVISVVGTILPAGSWKLVLILDIVVFAAAAIYAILGVSAALRMQEFDRKKDSEKADGQK